MQALANILKARQAQSVFQPIPKNSGKLKLTKKSKNNQDYGTNAQIYNKIQSLIDMTKQPNIKSNCQCNICKQQSFFKQKEQQDNLMSHQGSHINLYKLLTHLILISPDKVKQVLGEIRIPMLFFKRNRKLNKNSSKNIKTKNIDKGVSFLMFKCNQKTGKLQIPQIINTYQKVYKNIKKNIEKINANQKDKFKQQLYSQKNQQKQTKNLKSQQKFFHEKIFEISVPSMFMDTTINSNLRQNRTKPTNYIIHKNDAYLDQQIQNHKIHQTQSFCIFRYEKSKSIDPIVNNQEKYQIFTKNGMEKFIQKNQLVYSTSYNQNEGLNLMLIESFTKVKQMSIFTRQIAESIMGIINPQQLKNKFQKSRATPSIYFSIYNINLGNEFRSNLYELAKLQILLKDNQINKLDSRYLDSYDLQALIEKTLNNSQQNEQMRMQNISFYYTYKIVHFLEIILKIKVLNIQLRWILNQYNKLILTQCISYKIDELTSLFGELNSRKQKVVSNSLQLLIIGDPLSEDNIFQIFQKDSRTTKLQSILEARRKKLRQKQSYDQKIKHVSVSPEPKKKQLTKFNTIIKSLQLKNKKIKTQSVPQSPTSKKFKVSPIIQTRVSTENSGVFYSHDEEKLKMLEKKKRYIAQKRMKKKKFKLKPLKTQSYHLVNSNSQF